MRKEVIEEMVKAKRLDIIKGIVAPRILTENYLQAYKEGIEDAVKQMMKGAVQFYEILKVVPPGPERDKVKIIIFKED